MSDADVSPDPQPEDRPTARDHPKGYVGFVYEDVFKELYTGTSTASADPAEDKEEEADAGAKTSASAIDSEINLNKEAEHIKAIGDKVLADGDHVDRVQELLRTIRQAAREGDQDEAAELLQRWGLVMREQLPVPESKLKHRVDPDEMVREGLIVPRRMMEDMERFYEIKKGQIPQHDNLLAISKPEEPNHFKMTRSLQLRAETKQVKATLTEEQKNLITADLQERLRKRPRQPAGLNADQKAKNREIVKRMQMKVNFLKNPRFLADRQGKDRGEPCPFWFTPESILFRNYEIGGLYQIQVDFRNSTGISRRLRVLPCNNTAFSVKELRYDKELNAERPELVGLDPLAAVVAPGMAAHLTVSFAPNTLNDETEFLMVCTEIGDYQLPLLARRDQPKLKIDEPVNCGCMLAGNNITEPVRIRNSGGEGAFRLIVSEDEPPEDYCYESYPGTDLTLVVGSFRISPASFYLDANSFTDLSVRFEADKVGHHRCPLFVEGDNGVKTPLSLVAVCDAVRLELCRWPTLHEELPPAAIEEGSCAWQLVPWQLNWMRPGTQVGHKTKQCIQISNGGFMPMRVDWALAQPPRQILARLAVGSINRLTDKLINEIHDWRVHLPGSHLTAACPFRVEPASVTIEPFSTSTFTFTFEAFGPVGSQSAVFAYLVARDLPDSMACLLHYNQLVELQDEMRPENDAYSKHLPLFGGIVSQPFDKKLKSTGSTDPLDVKVADPKDCAVSRVITAVCLQGQTVGPTISAMPRAIVLPGDVLPFVPSAREIKVYNSGSNSSYFRVRLTSTLHAADANKIDPLWIVSVPEVGMKPEEPQPIPHANPVLEEMRLQAARLAQSWPPLPPEPGIPGASQLPGYGALASCAVEPHEGRIPPGGAVTIRVTLRVVHECDLDGQLVIDLPLDAKSSEPAAPALKVGISAAVRAPRAEMRSTSMLDFGVVRAHSRHTLKVVLSNPTQLPMMLQLRQFKDTKRNHEFPVESHREVVNLFVDAVNRRSAEGYAAIESEQYREAAVQPWVHSRSGCLDQSGRRKFGAKSRSSDDGDDIDAVRFVPDSEDFVFHPGYLALWPGKSGEVEVTLRTGSVGKYTALLEAVGFNSLHAQCLDVFASVQLPLVRINTHHAHFPVTYLRTASEPMEVELRNESEMPANFSWKVPVKMDGCLEAQIHPSQGSIPPRESRRCTIIAVPTKIPDDGHAVLPCHLFIEEILQPLELRVTAVVYGCEVDYAVVSAGELPPEIELKPRQPGDSPCDPRGTYMITSGKASRRMPAVDFGELPLQRAKVMQVVLYNRTGIATPYSVKVDKNPAFDPLVKGRKIGDYLDAATRMYALINQSGGAEPENLGETVKQSFENTPQPAGAGRDDSDPRIKTKKFKSTLNKTKKTSTKKKRWILDDKHERQAFRSSFGADFAKQKEMKEQGRMALRAGRGFAVKAAPASDWLQPFSTAVITVTSFSDLPGLMEDELILTLRELPGHSEGENFRIPLRLKSYGNPLYLPDQQVGLNTLASPPRLLCGVTVPAEKQLMRRFKVGNNSAARVVVNWKIFPKLKLENMAEDRAMIHVGLCGRNSGIKDPFVEELGDKDVPTLKIENDGVEEEEEELDPEEPFNFKIWSQQPPQIQDPFSLPGDELPVVIEPVEAVVPEHGTASFTVTMTCLKATLTAASNYRYTLIGDCRFTADREQRLAFAEANPDEEYDERPPQTAYVTLSQDAEVENLPDIQLDGREVVDDDSDIEVDPKSLLQEPLVEVPAPLEVATTKRFKRNRAGPPPPQPLAVEPNLDVLATIVIDCVGDCVLPRLTVDKKGNPAVEEFPAQNKEQDDIGDDREPPVLNAPVFKFTWSSMSQGSQPSTGPSHGGAVGGTQVTGISECLVRQISFSNHNAAKITCKFRVEGPFRIQLIQQGGAHPVLNDSSSGKAKKDEQQSDIRKLFVLSRWETVTLHVMFTPEQIPVSEWEHYLTKHEHVFRGDLIVEYPRDTDGELDTHKDDLQRIHLVGTARRPAVRVHVVPNEFDRPIRLERAERPPWSEPVPVVVEFGYTHVQSSVTRFRCILISNITNTLAKWSLVHVGRKRKAAPVIGATLPEEEEFRALDDKDAFEFDVSGGELPGPSKDGLVPGSEERLPHWCAKSSALPRAPAFPDEERFDPQRLKISFRPKKNELYKCRFRVQVESGLSIDFICRGTGSYDEEDDNLDFHEA